MGNRFRGEAEIAIGDEVLAIKYDWNTICELEERTSKSIAALFFSGDVSSVAIREALYCGLKWRYKMITPKTVGRKLAAAAETQADFLDELIKTLLAVIMAARGESDEKIEALLQMLDEEDDSAEVGEKPFEEKEGEDDANPLAQSA